MAVDPELAVALGERVQADAPRGVGGPFEAATRAAADVEHALGIKEAALQPELGREDVLVVGVAEHPFDRGAVVPVDHLGVALGRGAQPAPQPRKGRSRHLPRGYQRRGRPLAVPAVCPCSKRAKTR